MGEKDKIRLKPILIALVVILAVAGLVVGVVYESNKSSGKKRSSSRRDKETEQVTTEEESDVRTLMIYMVGSDLESGYYGEYGGAASRDIDEMLRADVPDNVNIVLQCGGADKWQNDKIPDGKVTRFTIEGGKLVEQESLGKTTMTRKGDLADFITYASENFPADNYTLILWDHGGGIPVGFGMDELGNEEDMMSSFEIKADIESAGIDFDAVIFDACNMCTLEMGMALKDHADYMVGAESYVNNAGIYYTEWLADLDGDASAYSEKILQDYMASINDDGLVGSMSVIRLDLIEDVYDAYINYIADLSADLDSGYYADYVKARSSCGAFDDIDSVDLIALATAYDSYSASDLINTAVNAVAYTDSDFAYGHGLMVYCPYEWYEYYSDGREAFVELDYDETITEFYDKFISQELAYLGDDYVEEYGGDWYNDEYTSSISAFTEAGEYDLDVVDVGNYYAVELDDADWDVIDYIAQTLVIETDDGEDLVLGEEYTAQIDSEGRLALVDPESWTFINDNIAAYYCLDYYYDEETGAWSQYGVIPITVNGEGALLYVYYDDEYPSGTIQGYSTYDFDTDEESDMLYSLEDDDVIDLAYQVYSADGSSYYMTMGESIAASDLELGYYEIDLNDYVTLGYYEVYDVYGNVYSTPIEYLGSNDYLE